MHRAVCLLALSAIAASAAERADQTPADENIWKKVFYLGGVPGVRVNRFHLVQSLVLTQSKLIVRAETPLIPDSPSGPKKATKELFAIPLESVVAVTYEGFRHDMHGTQGWIGIQGHWPKATDHLIIVDYRLPDGKEAEVLLRVDKKDHREIVALLRNRSGARRFNS